MLFILLCTIFLLPSYCLSLKVSRVSLFTDPWLITDHQYYYASSFLPGTVHTILLEAGQITEPYFGYNDDQLRNLIHSSWTFSTNFTLDDDFLQWKQFKLHFTQIDTVANITLNRCFLGRTISMFIPYEFVVNRSCLMKNNSLQIDFSSPIKYAAEQAEKYNETIPPDCPPDEQHGECHSQFIRKEPCSFSWDWGPSFAPIGIPGEVFLEGQNPTDFQIDLESVNVASFELSENQWRVDVILSSSNDPFFSRLKFVLLDSPFIYEVNTTISSKLNVSLFIPDDQVELWWPNGYGDQIVYNLTIYHQDQCIGSRQIGFRTVHLIQHDYGSTINGTSFYFLINYRAIFIKGSNWIPPDAFQERVDDDKLERLLRSAQLANINMLRIWGGGIYERDSFYDLADRLGIMLWHDFMFACSLYPVNEEFLDQVKNEVIYQVKRLQSHPSIVLWAGNNENEEAIAQNWYGVPPEKINQRKDDYRQLYVKTIMKTVQDIDGGTNRPFVTSSPSNGLETIGEDYIATDPNDFRYGDVHFYGYQDDSWDFRTYPITRFLSETGIQSLPSIETWYPIINQSSDLNLESNFIQHREHSSGQIRTMIKHIEMNLPLPIIKNPLMNFTQWIYLSQINQAMTLKSISDQCRLYSSPDRIDPKTSEGNTMGLMYWQINDIWQAPTWSTIEYELKWKMAHYYVRHMYEPIYPLLTLTPYLANMTDDQAQITLYMINEYLDDSQGDLICSIHSFETFMPRLSFAYIINYDLITIQHIANLPYASIMRRAGCQSNAECLMHCTYDDGKRSLEQTLFFTRPKFYSLRQPNLKIERVQQQSPTDWKIQISASHPALFVWLDFPSDVNGYFSRNGFHLFTSITFVDFHSWSPINELHIRISSLFDITQPW